MDTTQTMDQPISRNEHLAVVRTDLANQRTVLAFARTALMLLGTGLTFIKVFTVDSTMVTIGIALLPLSALVGVIGVWSYFHSRRVMHDATERAATFVERIGRFFRRMDDLSAAVVFAEAGEAETAMRVANGETPAVLVVAEDEATAKFTIGNAARLAQQLDASLVAWTSDEITNAAARAIARQASDSVSITFEPMPEHNRDAISTRLQRHAYRAILMDSMALDDGLGRILHLASGNIPVVVNGGTSVQTVAGSA
jgi:putative membrane protein